MIVQHPTRFGWLIVTPEVEALLNAGHQLVLPDGTAVHPLHFYEADIVTVEQALAYGLQYLNTWRGARRSALGLTSANFQELVYTGKVLESQRWLAAPGSAFGLAAEAVAHGISNEAMAALVLGQWSAWQSASDAIEAAYITARLWIEAAEDESEIARVLAGLK